MKRKRIQSIALVIIASIFVIFFILYYIDNLNVKKERPEIIKSFLIEIAKEMSDDNYTSHSPLSSSITPLEFVDIYVDASKGVGGYVTIPGNQFTSVLRRLTSIPYCEEYNGITRWWKFGTNNNTSMDSPLNISFYDCENNPFDDWLNGVEESSLRILITDGIYTGDYQDYIQPFHSKLNEGYSFAIIKWVSSFMGDYFSGLAESGGMKPVPRIHLDVINKPFYIWLIAKDMKRLQNYIDSFNSLLSEDFPQDFRNNSFKIIFTPYLKIEPNESFNYKFVGKFKKQKNIMLIDNNKKLDNLEGNNFHVRFFNSAEFDMPFKTSIQKTCKLYTYKVNCDKFKWKFNSSTYSLIDSNDININKEDSIFYVNKKLILNKSKQNEDLFHVIIINLDPKVHKNYSNSLILRNSITEVNTNDDSWVYGYSCQDCGTKTWGLKDFIRPLTNTYYNALIRNDNLKINRKTLIIGIY